MNRARCSARQHTHLQAQSNLKQDHATEAGGRAIHCSSFETTTVLSPDTDARSPEVDDQSRPSTLPAWMCAWQSRGKESGAWRACSESTCHAAM
eukprot:m.446696 g.446696  ORF g.446696 m.446696 type:complete len:94 (-) comp56871_c0_seq1:1873-2154(-)